MFRVKIRSIFASFVSAALALGAKESSLFNNVFTAINLSVVLFVIVAGAFKGKYYCLSKY